MKRTRHYKISELAKLSGVTTRTLRFYDEIDLLKPAHESENGYRVYGENEWLRLQQVMFYRELGFELNMIKMILDDPDFDQITALKNHRESLLNQSKRITKLITTIDGTVNALETSQKLNPQELYRGFDMKKQKQYEDDLISRYGEKAKATIAESTKKTSHWGPAQFKEVETDFDRLHRAIANELKKGNPSSSSDVQKLIDEHYKIVCRFWTPDSESYAGLGQLYCDHADFRKVYDAIHPKLAEYLAEAMKTYCQSLD